MKDEIKEIIQLIGNCCYHGEISEDECKKYCNYITNLQTIEQQYSAVLSENAELKNKIFDLEDTLIDKKEYCYGLETQLTILQKENERLKEIENFKFSSRKHETKTLPTVTKNYKSEYEDYKSRMDKTNEYIKENTRWFDSEYAKVYGELCDCAGAKGDRLEVLVNPSNLSKILGGDDNE